MSFAIAYDFFTADLLSPQDEPKALVYFVKIITHFLLKKLLARQQYDEFIKKKIVILCLCSKQAFGNCVFIACLNISEYLISINYSELSIT